MVYYMIKHYKLNDLEQIFGTKSSSFLMNQLKIPSIKAAYGLNKKGRLMPVFMEFCGYTY